jgi:hypothetical protein
MDALTIIEAIRETHGEITLSPGQLLAIVRQFDQDRAHSLGIALSLIGSCIDDSIEDRMERYVKIHGGPAKGTDGAYIGTCWPMMLEAVTEIKKLRAELERDHER